MSSANHDIDATINPSYDGNNNIHMPFVRAYVQSNQTIRTDQKEMTRQENKALLVLSSLQSDN